jgi:lipid II:glycine glycyltransferase (peptidoglycan interpeptide bridge formation enzyme)
MNYTALIDNITNQEWEQYAGNFTDYSIYQTCPYQQTRAEDDNQQVSRFIIKDENGQVATMGQVRIKKIKPLGLKIGYIQWGPLFRGKDGTLKCNAAALEKMRESYLGTTVNILRVVPNIFNDETGLEAAQMLQSCGFQPVSYAAPYRTIIFSLEGSEEDLKTRLDRNWRRNLKKAQSAKIEIKQSSNSEYFDILENLYWAAIKRKGFKGLDPKEFSRPQAMLSPQEKLSVTIAYFDGCPVTALATSNLGDTAVDILAANTQKALECGSSFLTYWTAFYNSRHCGMKRYDLGGIDPVKNPSVYEFKRRTGGKETIHMGAFEICENSIVKKIWHAADRTYRLLKK